MRTTITLRGPIAITYLRNGGVRIEVAKRERPRLHVRGDEFLRLIHMAAIRTAPKVAVPGAERFGAL